MAKRGVSDLALLGGRPAFGHPLHVGYPNLGDRAAFISRIEEILDRRWLTNDGKFVREFEQAIAELMDVDHCVAICNGTVALEIAIRACGLRGEVIVPGFTFVATPHALQWQGIAPVFADIEPLGHHIDPADVEARITPDTSGILAVHLWGRPCDIDALTRIATRRDLKLLFDAAHALGCSRHGEMIGRFGECEVLSFHATKVLNTLEGGAILTNDGELARKARLMRNFGFIGNDDVRYIGTNGKMNEVSAAMGLTLLDQFDSIVAANEAVYRQYFERLSSLTGLKFVSYDRSERNNFQYVVLEIEEEKTGISRDTIVNVLKAENVLARRYFYPGCHRMEPYRSLERYAGLRLPVTERVAERVLVLPTGPSISEADVDLVADILRIAVEGSAAILERLNEEKRPWRAPLV
jgi:dTDP-4-amino-4,6-dideoxygalactose transaminase